MAGLLFFLPAAFLFSPQALAHHPLGGGMPEDSFAAFLSGIGHPLIEAEHGVFLLAVGLALALSERPVRDALAFLLPLAVSAAMAVLLFVPPFGVALGLAAAVGLIGSLRGWWRTPIALWLGLGGAAHGLAYGEFLIGADSALLFPYLAGLVAINGVVLTALGRLGAATLRAATLRAAARRTRLRVAAQFSAALAILLPPL